MKATSAHEVHITNGTHIVCINSGYACLQKFIHTPNYAALGAEDKAALLEKGICPSFGLSGCDELLFMNFAADWNMLRPALEAAFTYTSPEHQAGGFKTILN